MVEDYSESFYAKYLRISLPFLILVFLSMQVFAITTNDTNYSSGIYNGDFENAPIYVADTNISGRWIDGTASGSTTNDIYGWGSAGTNMAGVPIKVGFSTTQKYSGNNSMYIDINLTTTNSIYSLSVANSYGDSTFPAMRQRYLVPVKPSTRYKASACYFLVSEDVNTASIGFRFTSYNSSLTRVSAQKTSVYTDLTIGGWDCRTVYFNTTATEVYILPQIQISDAVNVPNVVKFYVDDVRLEEVGTTTLNGQVSGRPSILVTGVSDMMAIDQADTNNSASLNLGTNLRPAVAQCFTPTQSSSSGFVFQKYSTEGDYKGDLIISLRKSTNGTTPDSTILASTTLTNTQVLALANNTDVFVYASYLIPDVNGTNKYCWDINSTTIDDVNYIRIRSDSGNNYSGGARADFNAITGTWAVASSNDLYFKTLFEKQSSAFDLNVCSAGDSVCESKTYDIDFLEDGETFTINPNDAPLFYAGDNNVYYMQHSDSDFNNKTPSMMAKLTYTFDKPTTTLNRTKGTIDNTEIITLTCTSGVTGTCDNTYYTVNGGTLTTYTTPFTLTNGTYTITYYSTADNNNVETTNSTTFQIATQPSKGACGMLNITVIILAAIIVLGILVIGFKAGVDPMIIISLVMFAVAGVLSTIILAGILFPICG
jgi:hypothetical protein